MCISFVIGFISSGNNIGELVTATQKKLLDVSPETLSSVKYFLALGGAAFTIFSGTFANIATTSFSREGKSLNDLKAMPLKFNMIIKAKFWHALLYVGIADVITINIVMALYCILKLPFSLSDMIAVCVLMTLTAVSISVLLIIIDMFIDTVHPKLNWETPMAACKQNLNVLWSMLLTLLNVGFLIVLVALVLPKQMISLVILSVIYVIISAPVGAGYFRYAEKKLEDM